MKLTKITTERKEKVKELILAGYSDWDIIHLVFGNENGHYTNTYYQIVKRIRKTLTIMTHEERLQKDTMKKTHKIYWTMRNGEKIDVDEMTIEHLRNTLKMIIRNGTYDEGFNIYKKYGDATEIDIY